MKFLILFLFPMLACSQSWPTTSLPDSLGSNIYPGDKYVIQKDWILQEVVREGKGPYADRKLQYSCPAYEKLTQHSWVWSAEFDPNPNYGCLVIHEPEGCDKHWPEKYRVCENCGRKELWKSQYKVHYYKTKFQETEEKWDD